MIAILLIALNMAALVEPWATPIAKPQDGVGSKQRDYPARLEQVVAAVEERFFQDLFELPNYLPAKQTARNAAKTCNDPQQFRDVVNRYLQALNASHTYYLTVRDVLVDGQRLEHRGVLPDVEVTLDLTTCDGIDRQREAALDEAVKRVQSSADLK